MHHFSRDSEFRIHKRTKQNPPTCSACEKGLQFALLRFALSFASLCTSLCFALQSRVGNSRRKNGVAPPFLFLPSAGGGGRSVGHCVGTVRGALRGALGGPLRRGGFKNRFVDVFRNRSKKWLCLQPQTLFFSFWELSSICGRFRRFLRTGKFLLQVWRN